MNVNNKCPLSDKNNTQLHVTNLIENDIENESTTDVTKSVTTLNVTNNCPFSDLANVQMPFAYLSDNDLISELNCKIDCPTVSTIDNEYSVNFPFSNLSNFELDCVLLNNRIDSRINIHENPVVNLITKVNDIEGNNISNSPYVTIDEILTSTSICKSTSLSMLHVNCRSLRKNYDSLINLIKQTNLYIDIIAVSETWLSSKDNVDMFMIPGYNLECINREYNRGGGVLCYICDKYSYQVNSSKSFSVEGFMDVLTLEITLVGNKHKNILISCVYKSPSVNIKMFLEQFEEFIELYKGHNSYIIGDLNVDILKHSTSKEISNFMDLMTINSFYPLINQPTRITKCSNSLIDNIWTNVKYGNSGINSYIIYSDISDHLPIMHITNDSIIKTTSSQVKTTYREFSKTNIDKINQELVNKDWNDVFTETNADNAYDIFHDYLQSLVNKYCPVKIKNNNKNQNSWMPNKLKNACRKKDNLYKKFLNNPSRFNMNKYKSFRNKLTKTLYQSQKTHYRQVLQGSNNCIKKTWQIINRVLHKNNKYKCIHTLEHKGQLINDNANISKVFNKHFNRVGKGLSDQFLLNNKNEHLNYLTNNVSESLFLYPTCHSEILDIVSELSNKKSSGYDEINMPTLKLLLPNILSPLVYIINISLSTGEFPSKLKIAKIIPIYKTGKKQDCNNYRPISLLTQISKIFEKIYYKRLINFLMRNNVIIANQFGFRENSNTSFAIIDMVENIIESLSDNKIPVGVFIDLQKAFDTIDHSILLDKLSYYGIRGVALKWIQSYLTNRKHFVYCNGTISENLDISIGVPQGSILGPLLFILYINDIVNVSTKLKFFLYADDTNILYADDNCINLKLNLESELNKLLKWLHINKLSINFSKTSYIIFGKQNPKEFDLEIEGKLLTKINSTKFLGVIIDSQLSWKDHIQYLETKIVRNVRTLNLIKQKLDKFSLIKVYNTLIVPNIMYCCEIWGNTSANKLNKLKLLQNKCLRIIDKIPIRTSLTKYFKDNRLLRINDIIFYKVCIFGFNAYNSVLPNSMQSYFTKKNSVHNYQTRNNNHFTLTNNKFFYSNKSIVANIKNTFNKIPEMIKQKSSLNSFKVNIKNFILEKY
jgi:hypothetical protein